jgi:hypothetical protein
MPTELADVRAVVGQPLPIQPLVKTRDQAFPVADVDAANMERFRKSGRTTEDGEIVAFLTSVGNSILLHQSRWNTVRHNVVRNVVYHHRASPDQAIRADTDALDHRRPDSYRSCAPDVHSPRQVHAGCDVRAILYHTLMADRRACVNDDVLADHRPRINDRPGHNDGTSTNLCAGSDDGARVDCSCQCKAFGKQHVRELQSHAAVSNCYENVTHARTPETVKLLPTTQKRRLDLIARQALKICVNQEAGKRIVFASTDDVSHDQRMTTSAPDNDLRLHAFLLTS